MHWSGPEVLEVPPNGSAEYTVTYCPVLMTKTDEEGAAAPHLGSVFFPLPDGSAILHALEGTAACVRLLLSHGADVNLAAINGERGCGVGVRWSARTTGVTL